MPTQTGKISDNGSLGRKQASIDCNSSSLQQDRSANVKPGRLPPNTGLGAVYTILALKIARQNKNKSTSNHYSFVLTTKYQFPKFYITPGARYQSWIPATRKVVQSLRFTLL